MIELSYLSGGEFVSEFDGIKYRIESNSLCLYMPDMEVVNHCEDSKPTRMLDVAFYVDRMEYERFECNSKDEWAEMSQRFGGKIILPFKLKFENMNENLVKSFYTIIQLHSIGTVSSELSKIGEWFKLLAMVNDETRKLLAMDNEYSNTLIYLRKIERYIQSNYNKKIKLDDVAKELKVSQSYLCRIFKENLNETFVSYLNKTRVNKAREMLSLNPNESAVEIAENVGFCDLRYMNKMFRRYYGINVRECRRLDRELTLFHKKPWDAENLDKDIYKTEEH